MRALKDVAAYRTDSIEPLILARVGGISGKSQSEGINLNLG
jgi:hypothetical protein